jgi:hypothetical protein
LSSQWVNIIGGYSLIIFKSSLRTIVLLENLDARVDLGCLFDAEGASVVSEGDERDQQVERLLR